VEHVGVGYNAFPAEHLILTCCKDINYVYDKKQILYKAFS